MSGDGGPAIAAAAATTSLGPDEDSSIPDEDPLYDRLRSEALRISTSEPSMSCLLSRTVLHPSASTFEGAVASAISHRLALACGPNPDVCPNLLRDLFERSLSDPSAPPELGHTAGEGIRADALAHVDRDPACETLLEAVLFFKGYAAAVSHRVARRQWHAGERFSALWIQSQASAAFGVDIHPAASIGAGVMFDHATGVVVGETACIGDGCTLLHGVTLGGTGKDSGDRHPKVGRDVLIGANASVLGNIKIGDGAKIGAGSVVLRPVPHGATAVGAPAKIIGWAKEHHPGSNIDQLLVDVVQAGGRKAAAGTGAVSASSRTDSTASLTTEGSSESLSQEEGSEDGDGKALEKERGAEDRAAAKVGAEAGEDEKEAEEVAGAAPKLVEKREGAEEPPRPPPPIASGQRAATVGAPPQEEEEEEGAHKIRFNGDVRPLGRKVRSASYPLDTSNTDLTALDAAAAVAGGEEEAERPHAKTLEDLPDDDCCSPFRDFRLRHAPPGCVTYCSLRSLLRSAPPAVGADEEAESGAGEGAGADGAEHKVTDDEVGEVFWELLRRTGRPERRYVPRATFEECFVEVASGFTGLGEERCTELLERAREGCSKMGKKSSSPTKCSWKG